MFLRKTKVKTKKGVKEYYQIAETYVDLRGVERTKILAHLGTVEKMLANHKRLREGVMLE